MKLLLVFSIILVSYALAVLIPIGLHFQAMTTYDEGRAAGAGIFLLLGVSIGFVYLKKRKQG